MLTISDEALCELPVDALGLMVLADYAKTNQWNTYNYVIAARQERPSKDALRALSEALAWLLARGLLVPDLEQSSANSAFVSRAGRRVLTDGPDAFYATERLQRGLHPEIAAKARPQFLLGQYELGVFASLKAVEVRVRALARLGDDVHGVEVFNRAFGKGGVLVDPTSVAGEQEGIRGLFAGAYAVFRNPAGHRDIDYDDVAEAAEAVQRASLLMRILDRIEATRSEAP